MAKKNNYRDPKAEELTSKMRLGLDPWKPVLGAKDIDVIVATVPKSHEEACELLRKYNSVAGKMNKVLKDGMADYGFKIGFDESGAFIINQKGTLIKTEDCARTTKKRKPWD